MNGLVPIEVGRILPSHEDVYRRQGIPPTAKLGGKVTDMADRALELFASEARPACVARDVSAGDFGVIFRGEGGNDDDAPLRTIYPRADHLVLFALTVGEGVSGRIAECFAKNDFAPGSMLDTVASLAVEKAAAFLEDRVAGECAGKGRGGEECAAVNYSPGYCGWHLGAQRGIFRYLDPGQIGITLNDSCLMTPLKSATGVLVHGEKAIHHFGVGFSFCVACTDRTCIERMDRL